MGYPLFIVDVFAEEKYAGNQLAVVLHDGELSPARMQAIARETNFSETTFVGGGPQADGAWPVRIFTPASEIPFAGHPSLGTAWVLRELVAATRPERVVLALPIGPTPVRFDDAAGIGWLTARHPTFGPRLAGEPFADILGLQLEDIDTALPIVAATLGVAFTLVPLADVAALGRARFREACYEQHRHLDFPGSLFLFCRDGEAGNLRARMFGTPYGIIEDPATGSANAFLAAYLLRHPAPGRERVAAQVRQGVEMGRPSLLHLAAERRGDDARIEVGGRVVLSLRGELV